MYDIFISFKSCDENGKETEDSKIAGELYKRLKDLGYNPFFSTESIPESGESRFRKLIDKALNECSLMVQILTKAEYLSSWMGYEYRIFSTRAIKNEKLNIYVLLSGVKPEEVSSETNEYQALFMEKGWEDIFRYIRNALPLKGVKESSPGQDEVAEDTADLPEMHEQGDTDNHISDEKSEGKPSTRPHGRGNKCSVTGLGSFKGENLIILSEYGGDTVVRIDDEAFSGEKILKSVDIPTNVTSIGKNAFLNCMSLNKVTLKEGLEEIGEAAFKNCKVLENIGIPNSVSAIGGWAFAGCASLKTINISGNQTSLGLCVFQGCSSLTTVTFHLISNLHKVPLGTFEGCRSLTHIVLPRGLKEISREAFKGCEALSKLNIPETVKNLGEKAFYKCSALRQIDIPQGVTKIAEETFYGCNRLTNVVIPQSVTVIESAFTSCDSLTNVFYGGTYAEWEKIKINAGNADLLDATRYLYCENNPTKPGRFWHYDKDRNPVVWDT